MKKSAFPIEVPFRVFVGLAFLGTITFHLLGLGIHTYIAHLKTRLVFRIETLAEVRSGILGLGSTLTLLQERSGKILGRPAGEKGRDREMQGISSQSRMITLLLANFAQSDPEPPGKTLSGRWATVLPLIADCRRNPEATFLPCLRRVRSSLLDFMGNVGRLESDVSRRLVEVEDYQSRLERWDTLLYWLTTFLGLLFMAVSWRSVMIQVGNPIQDVAHYLETYRETTTPRKVSFPGLFSIRELTLLKRSMRNVHNDYLTGALARHAILGILEREISLSTRSGAPFTAAIFDLDFFKRINDTYGHPAGDAALCHAVNQIGSAIRPSDWLGRWGGEEFLLICPGMSRQEALERLGQILEKIRKPLYLSEAVHLSLTASAGAAFFPERRGVDEIIGAAD